MSELVKPEIVEAKYADRMICGLMAEPGRFWERELSLGPDDSFQDVLQEEKLKIEHGLLWVNFFKDALITVRHPEIVLPESSETHLLRQREGTLRGATIEGGESEYVIGVEDDWYAFMTKEAILETGELPEYMRGWLFDLATKANFWSSSLNDFLPLMPGALESHFQVKQQ